MIPNLCSNSPGYFGWHYTWPAIVFDTANQWWMSNGKSNGLCIKYKKWIMTSDGLYDTVGKWSIISTSSRYMPNHQTMWFYGYYLWFSYSHCHTCAHLCSHVFTYVHLCPPVFTCVHLCPPMFTKSSTLGMWHTVDLAFSFRVDLLTYIMPHYHRPSHKCLISIAKSVCSKIDCACIF